MTAPVDVLEYAVLAICCNGSPSRKGTCPSNPDEDPSTSKFPLLDRRGVCALNEMAPFLSRRRRGGRSRNQRLLDLPPRRSRSKTIARVCPSCPGGEIGSLIRRARDLYSTHIASNPAKVTMAFQT